MVKLQNLLFPDVKICFEKKMFYRLEGGFEDIENNALLFPINAKCGFDTYFNSFSIRKWDKYTKLTNVSLHIKLRGDFRVRLFSKEMMGSDIITKFLYETDIHADETKDFYFPYPMEEKRGLFAFQLIALADGAEYFGGSYETEIDEEELSDIHIGVTICTFKREAFVTKIIETFRSAVEQNVDSGIYHKFHVYVADNGQTLDAEALSSEYIQVCPNKNLGGAGGFTRGLIEILDHSSDINFSHVLFLDDDILLPEESLFRTYRLLQMMRDEYREAQIAGGQFFLDRKNIQSEMAGHWDTSKHHPIKYKYNMNDLKWIIKSEIDDKVNYIGWCYCCIPFNQISYENLPLPFFIKRDDTEYGLRNGRIFIGLNGICMWHEPFEYKRSPYLEYYYIRNACITDAIHRPGYGAKQAAKALRAYVVKNLKIYRYKDIDLYFKGLEDFLKGVDWLKAQDGETLNKQVMGMTYQLKPVEQLNFMFAYGRYEASLKYKEPRKKRLIRKVTFNGLILPAKKTVVVPTVNPNPGCFYRVKTALNYECVSNRGYLVTKDYSETLRIFKHYLRLKAEVKANYNRIRDEYHERYRELTNIEFWRDYLSRETADVKVIQPPKRAKTTLRMVLSWYKTRVVRGIQHCLFWVPPQKNRVILHVENRKGYTCNPKYIAEALLKNYPNKFEIYWATDYPETVENLREKGIIPLKTHTSEFFRKRFRAKVVVTNDHLSERMVKRKCQYLINTWHASVAYKKIGFSINFDRGPIRGKMFEYQHKGADLVTSGSQTFSDYMPDSFRLPRSVFRLTGSARNDIFFRDCSELKAQIYRQYGITPESRIVLYAPTFRGLGTGRDSTYGLDFGGLLQALEQRFGGSWICLYRAHYFYKSSRMIQGVVNVTEYPDMQELLAISDVLITDYSSCIWDFSVTLRPSFIYATDLSEYIAGDRDFYNPIQEWPYPMASSNQELKDNILAFDNDLYVSHVKEHHAKLGLCETGHASDTIAQQIYEVCYK